MLPSLPGRIVRTGDARERISSLHPFLYHHLALLSPMQEDVARLDIVLWLSAQQTLIQLPDSATETYPCQ
jgi:hypothetical protein